MRAYSLRILVPPPVPVTHPRVQNFLHSSGIRLAGCWLSEDLMRWSLFSEWFCWSLTSSITIGTKGMYSLKPYSLNLYTFSLSKIISSMCEAESLIASSEVPNKLLCNSTRGRLRSRSCCYNWRITDINLNWEEYRKTKYIRERIAVVYLPLWDLGERDCF